MNKKKRKVFLKINLLETSAVGIPSYPFAHLSSDNFSLIKALSSLEADDEQLNLNFKTMEEEEKKIEEEEAPKAEAEGEAQEEENEKSESVESESAAEESSEDDSEKIDSAKIEEAVAKAVEKVLQKKTERGLVAEENLKEELKKKSVGELALMCGLFNPEG